MRNLILALAASALLAGPAIAKEDNGKAHAWGKNKVCLVAFNPETGVTGLDDDVIGAQYLPLPAALALKDALSEIYTYGPDGLNVEGVDHPNTPNGTIGTEEQCAIFAAATSVG